MSRVQAIGLRADHVTSGPMQTAHIHPELELNYVLSGSARYATVGGSVDLPRGRLAAFWGGYPHRLVSAADVDLLWATIPLSAVVGAGQLRGALDRLLRGAFLYGSAAESAHDRFLMRRWRTELSHAETPGSAPSLDVCLLEMHARLARLASGSPAVRENGGTEARSAERMLAVIARRYTERLSVAEIARAARVHPTYAALAFKRALGMPVWDYVTRLRVTHARRLLSGTAWGVDRVAHESGFQSRSSFYRAFREQVGRTPVEYRSQVAEDQVP